MANKIMKEKQKEKQSFGKKKKTAKASQANFPGDKEPCWEIRGCSGQPGGAPECPAYSNRQRPCWEWQGTICKGVSGKDISVCQICEVYLRYGRGAKIKTPKKAPTN